MEKRFNFTKTKIISLIREGYGQGCRAGYKLWLWFGDFPSHGRCHRIRDIEVDRIFHYFWDLERFPLFSVCMTEHIVSSMKYKHPQNIGDHNSCVMTADFLVMAKKSEMKRNSLHGCSLIAK